jgi:hypothetical protein
VDAAPIAKLTVTPGYGPAPIYVTFDATESFDAEGGIAEYRFDFDADGIIDYSTLDESPPETTSTGKAVEIEPGDTPGIVTVRFMKGDAEYMYPSVSVLDEAGFESLSGDREARRVVLGAGTSLRMGWKQFITSTRVFGSRTIERPCDRTAGGIRRQP